MPPRPKKGDRRIDAAIDHFAPMGFAARDVRAIVNGLLKEYAVGAAAWPLLEEGSYQLVLDTLIKKQEEDEKQQQLLRDHHPQEEEHEDHHPQEEEQLPPQHQELAEVEAPPENKMPMLEVHHEASESRNEGLEDPLFSELPTHPIAIRTRGTVRPCYGWISESDDEEELTDQQPAVSGGGGLLCKRKQPE
ncbi:hypothetical protein QOZ80_6BG0476580 [Eleusine coracana subsp. coracana]|nr:hypothetical protein QOZ80_6BG0476580 [Eleusine coracana subsp. coracana]